MSEIPKMTNAEVLANMLTGSADISTTGAAVLRSHRFPHHLYIQIENMARLGGVSIAVIINQLIECGLEAVRKELPEEVNEQLLIAKATQLDTPTVEIDESKRPKKTLKQKISK